MTTPKVTVLMAVYNGQRFLRPAIDSVLKQTFQNFEFLIIDDGSTDDSVAIIESYKDPRIRLIIHDSNKKLIATLNEGIDLARANFIARMDADDISHPDRLQIQYDYLTQHSDIVMVGSDIETINEAGEVVTYEPAFLSDTTLRRTLAVTNGFAHGSVMFRKATIIKAGKYNPEAYLVEDYDLWVRVAQLGKIANIGQALYKWRINPAGETLSHSQRMTNAAQAISHQVWQTFGADGPAPRSAWPEIWGQTRHGAKHRNRRAAELHIQFARGYIKYHRRGLAFWHTLAAIQREPFFLPFYFYFLSLILPAHWFFALEEKGIQLMKRRRGWYKLDTSKPKPCLVQPTLYPEQGRIDIYEYSLALAQHNIDTHVIICRTVSGILATLPEKLHVTELNVDPKTTLFSLIQFTWRSFRTIRHLRYHNRINMVHLFNPSPATFILIILLRLLEPQLKLIYDVRTGGVGHGVSALIINKTVQWSRFFADGIIVLSSGVRHRFFSQLNRPSAIVPLGVNMDSFQPVTPRKSKIYTFTYLGTLDFARQLDRMVEAFALVHKQHKNTKLIIIGDGNGRHTLEKWVKDHHLSRSITFLGKIDYTHIPNELAKTNCGLSFIPQTEWFEYQPPLKTLEYLASNLPTVATATAAHKEIWHDLPPSLLTNDTPQAFAHGMISAYTTTSLTQFPFRSKIAKFDWNQITQEKLIPFYVAILNLQPAAKSVPHPDYKSAVD